MEPIEGTVCTLKSIHTFKSSPQMFWKRTGGKALKYINHDCMAISLSNASRRLTNGAFVRLQNGHNTFQFLQMDDCLVEVGLTDIVLK